MGTRIMKSIGAVAAIVSVIVFLRPTQVTIAQQAPAIRRQSRCFSFSAFAENAVGRTRSARHLDGRI